MAKAKARNTDGQMSFDEMAEPEPSPPAPTVARQRGPAKRRPSKDRPSSPKDTPSELSSTESSDRETRHVAASVSSDHLPAVLQLPVEPPVDEPTPDLKDKLVVLIDAHSLIYQVFHALPPMTSGSGLPVAAVYGFVGDMLELVRRKSPDYLIACFDKGEHTFRNDLYDQYKANRDSMPDELRQQIPLIRQTIDAMGVAIVEQGGFEADDLLATLSTRVDKAGGRCLVVTSDKDCRQLISERVQMYNLRKDQIVDAAELWDLWGVRPDQVVDFQSLVGDAVDNVPGISLIGPKLAQQLLEKYDTLEGVLDNAENVSGKKRKQNLLEGREKALLSRKLVQLDREVASPVAWSRGRVAASADMQRTDALLAEFNFRGLRSRAAEVIGGQAAAPPVELTKTDAWANDYQTIDTPEKLTRLVKRLTLCDRIAIDTETTSTRPRSCDLVGLSIAWSAGQAAYIPVRAPEGETVIEPNIAIEMLRPVLESDTIAKIGHNLKFDIVVLRAAGVSVGGIALDTMLADYLLEPGGRNHTWTTWPAGDSGMRQRRLKR